MTDPEIQALVVDIVQASLKLLKATDTDVTEFLETVIELEIEELKVLNGE